MEKFTHSIIKRIAFIGNYLPRQCGIATFTTDLGESISGEYKGTACIALPVNDTEDGYEYPAPVRFELTEKDIKSYRRAADFLNINNVNVVSLQQSFILGLLTCLAWSPCFGPYVVAVAAYSTATGNVFYSALNMILFAAGFSLTLFVLALLASRIDFERISEYSNYIRIISGLVIVLAGIYMLWGLL